MLSFKTMYTKLIKDLVCSTLLELFTRYFFFYLIDEWQCYIDSFLDSALEIRYSWQHLRVHAASIRDSQSSFRTLEPSCLAASFTQLDMYLLDQCFSIMILCFKHTSLRSWHKLQFSWWQYNKDHNIRNILLQRLPLTDGQASSCSSEEWLMTTEHAFVSERRVFLTWKHQPNLRDPSYLPSKSFHHDHIIYPRPSRPAISQTNVNSNKWITVCTCKLSYCLRLLGICSVTYQSNITWEEYCA